MASKMIEKIFYYYQSEQMGQLLQFSQQFCKSKGLSVEFERAEFADDFELTNSINKKLNEKNIAIRLELELSSYLVSQLKVASRYVSTIQGADCFLPVDGKLWPRVITADVVRDLIVGRYTNLDMKDTAYVIGTGSTLRAFAGVAISLGYHRVILVAEDMDALEKDKKIISGSFIGVDIQLLSLDLLTLQTIGASLLLIAQSIAEGSEIETDIAYFNFLKSHAVVLNQNIFPLKGAIFKEAERAGFRLISGWELSGAIEFSFLEQAGILTKADYTGFIQQWADATDKIKT